MKQLGVLDPSAGHGSARTTCTGNCCSIIKYGPDYPCKILTSKGQACHCVAEFVGWYYHRNRHSGIICVTSQQRHGGQAKNRRHRSIVVERACSVMEAIKEYKSPSIWNKAGQERLLLAIEATMRSRSLHISFKFKSSLSRNDRIL